MTQPELPIDFTPKPTYQPAALARAGAHAYVQKRGGAYTPPRPDTMSPRLLHFATAADYERNVQGGVRSTDSEVVARSYEAMRKDTADQHRFLTSPLHEGGMGLKHEVVDYDPYPSPQHMADDVRAGRIRTMATSVTGSHPFFSNEENDQFRATHDVLGHAAIGSTFSRHGEEQAWQSHAQMYSPEALAALTSETRGQNSILINRGGFPEDQSAGVMSRWTESLNDQQFNALSDRAERIPGSQAARNRRSMGPVE